MADTETGTARPAGTIGRDVYRAAIAARDTGKTTYLTVGGERIAMIVPLSAAGGVVGHYHDATGYEDVLCTCSSPGTYAPQYEQENHDHE